MPRGEEGDWELNDAAKRLVEERERAKELEAQARQLKKEADNQEQAKRYEAEARRIRTDANIVHSRAMEDQTLERRRNARKWH